VSQRDNATLISHPSSVNSTVATLRNASEHSLHGSVELNKSQSLATSMPIYQFQVVEDHKAPDVRWTHLSDDEAAKRYGRLLIKDFKVNDRRFHPRCRMEIKDDVGRSIATLSFEDS